MAAATQYVLLEKKEKSNDTFLNKLNKNFFNEYIHIHVYGYICF